MPTMTVRTVDVKSLSEPRSIDIVLMAMYE